ncbi:MAG: 30S ribosomal protein S4 [Euryarchaeota archaeon]|nr:30S ribosomal protein S4 [Euryarchaeota archaeon]MDE1837874.1 30S ribosomal protein S4 [Euryarchaeota archaeon]MDE1881655.1 30S ribosomal protein S4 [Euryarchaeota archaeon]MDE2046220.1 30S ribosomal protein S4 [Thermoplasmata archaeon]
MGDPKFLRRTYDTPKHPWEQARMDEERKLLAKYGLKNKRELWKAESLLRNYRRQARQLQARLRAKEPQAEKETKWLLDSLARLGMLPTGTPSLDDVLALETSDLVQRRLQWIVYVKGLAATTHQARQLIVHGHISVGDHRVTRPGYFVRSEEEPRIAYDGSSPLSDEGHQIRSAIRAKAESAANPVSPMGEGPGAPPGAPSAPGPAPAGGA